MGQLLNRLKNFAKIQFRNDETSNADAIDIDDADDLKRQIDEASRQTGGNSTNRNNDSGLKGTRTSADIEALRTLGLKPNATISEIKDAYKRLVKKYHPDLNSGLNESDRKAAELKTMEINRAYELLEKSLKF